MLVIVLVIYTCTHPWRMMPHQVPLISLDCLVGILVLLLMLLYDVQPVRSTMSKMPKLKRLGMVIVRQLKPVHRPIA